MPNDWFYDTPANKNKEKYWILDFSFYVYNGTYAFKRPCECLDQTTRKGVDGCFSCGGSGWNFLQNKEGFITGGLFHVMEQIMLRLNEGYKIIVAFDPPKEDLIRTKLLDGYKGNRGEKPEYICLQMDFGEKLLQHLPTVECYTSDVSESDDVMAAKALELANLGHKVVVASDDKDMYPLLQHDNIDIYRQKAIFTKNDFMAKFGFQPSRFNEYLALCGDSADNFNLFKGIGDKAAKYLINKYDHVLHLFDDWGNVPPKYQKFLACEEGNKRIDDLHLSLRIATLDDQARCISIDRRPDKEKVKEMFSYLEFYNCLKNINLLLGEKK